MFKQRLLAALVLIPLVLAIIYYSNQLVFVLIALLLVAACSYEWLQLIPAKDTAPVAAFALLMVAACYAVTVLPMIWLYVGLALWAVILVLVQQYPGSQTLWGRNWLVALFALLLLPLFGQSLVNIVASMRGKELLVYLLCLVWAADTGAYLAGKQWGRHKLIPAVSPGKTMEGVAGGLVLAALVALVGYACFQPQYPVRWFALALATALISLLGDLFISMLKRRTGIKDTGRLIPGHGGVLDRLDSLVAAVPLFYFGLYFLNPGYRIPVPFHA